MIVLRSRLSSCSSLLTRFNCSAAAAAHAAAPTQESLIICGAAASANGGDLRKVYSVKKHCINLPECSEKGLKRFIERSRPDPGSPGRDISLVFL